MKWAVTAVCVGWGAALLAGCGDTQQEPPVFLPPSGNVAGAAGAGFAAAGSAGSDPTGAAGGPVQMPPCAADMNPEPAAPSPVTGDVIDVVPSNGCGREYQCDPSAKRTLQTMGTKAADCADMLDGKHVCGDWSVTRDFRVYLPAGYDPQKPYPLVLEAPGCNGNAGGVLALNNVRDQTIRVGISPGPNSTGHGTYPNNGCFDDHEGDDSIDWVFYERLYDRLNDELCFDRQRVFVNADGGGFANELGCKYAGDAVRPVRAVLVDSGRMPTEPQYLPTCSQGPLAGMWVHQTQDLETPFEETVRAVSRAMALAHCPGGDYAGAQLRDFPIGAGQPDDMCKLIVNCDEWYPLVVCSPPTTFRTNTSITDPGFAVFIKLFKQWPLAPPQ